MNAVKNIRKGLQYQYESGKFAAQKSDVLYCAELLKDSAATTTGRPRWGASQIVNLKEMKDREWTEHHDTQIK